MYWREAYPRRRESRRPSSPPGDASRPTAATLGVVLTSVKAAVSPWVAEADRLDHAVYRAIATTSTPRLDLAMRRLSQTADYSKLWIGCGAVLMVLGPRSRLAARCGLLSVAVTSAFANLVVKPIGDRSRPDRTAAAVPEARTVGMPASRSFPSGHSASAMAFATATAHVLPPLGVPLRCLAGAVAYSRVHTGVHYPGDALAGALIGATIGDFVTAAVRRREGCDDAVTPNG